jgi:hypothetical protein
MFNLLPTTKIVALIAASYGFFLLSFSAFLSPSDAFRGAAVVDIVLFALLSVGWRWLWIKVPALNRWIYPDLNGHWVAKIHWVQGNNSGVALGTAHITQDFFRFGIDVDASNSASNTIALVLKKDTETGKPLLHYIYEVREKHTRPGGDNVYRGAASLTFDALSDRQLSGNYFTSRSTAGRFQFSRLR